MSAAFVLATPVRRAVFLDIAAGEASLDRIVAKNRLIRAAAERAAREFVEKGLVSDEGGEWRLTEAGGRLKEELHKSYL